MKKDIAECKYRHECIEGCTHSPENCALYKELENYNQTHHLDIDPVSLIVSRLHNHGFEGLQEIVVLEAIGLKAKDEGEGERV